MRSHRLGILLVLALLLMGTVFGTQAQSSNTLKIGIVTPQSLDPAIASNDGELLIIRSLHDYLVEILPDRTIGPNLATDWTVSEDGLTYTFNLVEGVKFHDGSDFSSADVVSTFNHLKEAESPALNLLGEFEVSAPDAKTVVFTLTQPNADFLYGIGDRFASIEKEGDNLVGTGPFVVSENESDHLTVTKNPDYWQEGKPLLDSVTFSFIDDPVTQVNALRSGDVDFIFKISPDQISTLESDSSVTVLIKPTNLHPVIRLRTDEGPGADPNVRLAFKYATDREQANELVLEGRGIVGNNDPIGPAYGAFFDDAIENPTYDPQKSCDLLKEAGYPDGVEMTLQTVNVLGYDTLATVLQQQWEPACIKVEVQVNEEGF
jgi:ABC-type transport system substrate-binding protein